MLTVADTARVREAALAPEVIGQYVRLRPAGQGRLTGLCPFHNEKSPSFTVSTTKNLYKCFGCGEGGDVIRFVQRIEGLRFPDAVRRLAEQTGVVLSDRPMKPGQLAAIRRQQRLIQESAIWRSYVREQYRRRFETVMAIAIGASDRNWEPVYQRYARRAWRWGKILRRWDAMDTNAAVWKYQRVCDRLRVQRTVGELMAAERSERETWERILGAVRPEHLEGVVEMLARVGRAA